MPPVPLGPQGPGEAPEHSGRQSRGHKARFCFCTTHPEKRTSQQLRDPTCSQLLRPQVGSTSREQDWDSKAWPSILRGQLLPVGVLTEMAVPCTNVRLPGPSIFFFFFFFFYLFMTVLGLHFCVRAFSSCGKRGPLFIAVRGPLTIAASLVAEHRLQTRRLSNVAHGPGRFAACGIFPDQGSNPCPLHWQADSQPLRHQGSPGPSILKAAEPCCLSGWSVSLCPPVTGSSPLQGCWFQNLHSSFP